MLYNFSTYELIPEKIQNWVIEQPEYPTKGPNLGSMKRLDLDVINTIVNERYNSSS